MTFIPLKARGIAYIISAAFFYSLMSLFVRLSGDIPVMQKAFFRNIIAASVALAIMVQRKDHRDLHSAVSNHWFALLMRTVFGTLGLVCNFWAVDHLPIADTNMLNKMAPFFAILMSIPIVREHPKKIDLFCVVGAFIGALFVLKPGGGVASFPALIALFGGFCSGTAYAFIRQMRTHGVPGSVIIFFFSLCSALVCLPFLLFNYAPMTERQMVFLLMTGLTAAGGQISVTAAYACAPAREISVFDYSQVLFAALFGIFIFAEIPDVYSIIGYVVIIGMAILRWHLNLHGAIGHTPRPEMFS